MNWEGFLMGVSDFGLERLKEERQKKMLKELEELKETHKIAAEKRQEKLLARQVHRTEEDAEGRLQDYSVFGDPLNDPREQSPWVSEQRTMARDKHADDLETSASTRNYQSRSLDLRGQEMSERRRDREAALGANMPAAPDSPEAAIEKIFEPLMSTAKNPAEQALMWDVATETYEAAMAPGAESPPTDAAMRASARRRIRERMAEGQFGQTWRYDPQAGAGGTARIQ